MSNLVLPEYASADLGLGDNHILEWITDGSGRIIGAHVWHNRPRPPTEMETPWCCGSVLWEHGGSWTTGPLWQIQGEPGPEMTLSPSILCGCGDHGFIRQGRWCKA